MSLTDRDMRFAKKTSITADCGLLYSQMLCTSGGCTKMTGHSDDLPEHSKEDLVLGKSSRHVTVR